MRNRAALANRLAIVLGLLSACADRGLAQSIDVDSIREHLRQQWESIESIQWTLDEYMERIDGVALPTPAHLRYEMSRSKGGLSLYKNENAAKGHESILEHIFENGKKRYRYLYLRDYPGVIHELDISAQQTIDEGLSDIPQNSITWLTTPSGKPLYMHMTSEARAQEIDEDGRKLIEVVFPIKGSTLRCLLDPERDWSAVSVEFQDSERTRWKVTEFQRDNGRWFASEGIHAGMIMGRFQEWKFTVSNLKINRPIAPETYEQARLPSGALVVDRIKNTKHVWNGTKKTRDEFLGRHPSKEKLSAPTVVPPPIRASRDPDGDAWFYAPAALACALLALTGILKLRRGRAS